MNRRRSPETEVELEPLPASAARYLRFMGVTGRPHDGSFRLAWTGRFRRSLRASWTPCQAWQYNTVTEISRIFHARLRMVGVLSLDGCDTYVAGRGRLVVRAFGRFTMANLSGPELDISELSTWLADAVLFAPSMLLDANVSWATAGQDAFDLALDDNGHRVSARVTIDSCGAPTIFSTADRYCENPAHPKRWLRARWSTLTDRWGMVEGRPVPVNGRAVWHLPQGEFPYAELEVVPASLKWNVPID